MGRLIDADKLWKVTTTSIDYCGDFLEIIEKQETVDAIPVDWIQRYANACEAVSKTVGGTATKLSAEAVNVMLDYWREEQNGQTG